MSETEHNPDFTTCPKCGCDKALITAVWIAEDLGKLEIYCPVCGTWKVIEWNESEEHKKQWEKRKKQWKYGERSLG